MKKTKCLIAILLVIVQFTFSQNNSEKINFNLLGNPPDSIPKIFAKGIISIEDRYEYGLAISPNYDEIFFTTEDPGEGLMVTNKLDNGTWSNPRVANLKGDYSWEQEAFYTPNGKQLYFASADETDTTRIWRSFKKKIGLVESRTFNFSCK